MIEVVERKIVEEIKVNVTIKLIDGVPQDGLAQAIYDKLPDDAPKEAAEERNIMHRR